MKHYTQFANDLVKLERFRQKLPSTLYMGKAAEIEKQDLERLVASEKAELTPLLLAAIVMFKDSDHGGNKSSFIIKYANAILLIIFGTFPKKSTKKTELVQQLVEMATKFLN